MCSGVSKSGSPAPKPIISRPAAFNCAANAVIAKVGEGLTRCTRSDSCMSTIVYLGVHFILIRLPSVLQLDEAWR